MCVICGCSNPGGAKPAADPATPAHVRVDARTGDLHYGAGAARVSIPGMSQQRAIRLEADLLGENDRIAALNRAHFESHGVAAYNLVSSPGAGKTTLLCATIEALRRRAPGLPVAVIEGDQQTANDAERIRATGAPAIQVNTGKGCHLDAQMVADAFGRLPLHAHDHDHDHVRDHGLEHAHDHAHDHDHLQAHGHSHEHTHAHTHVHDHGHEHAHDHLHAHGHAHEHAHEHAHDHAHPHAHLPAHLHEHAHAHEHTHAHTHVHDHAHHHRPAADPAQPAALLFIENVGNLVCPAVWDLGERAKVVILSVTEGEDKPLKYPDMFAAARLMLLNKTDLLPHVDFDVDRCIGYARRVNPGIEVLQVSARSGEGLAAWLDWLLQPGGAATDSREAALRARIAELEARLARAGLA